MRIHNYKNGLMAAVAATALVLASGSAALAADPDLASLQKQINDLSQQLQALQAKQAAAAAATPTALPSAAPSAFALEPPPPPGTFAPLSFLGAFKIPGTNTSVKLGGRAELDMSYDANAGIGAPGAQSYGINAAALTTGKAGFALPGTQAANQTGRFQESARNSRITVETRTPTDYGEVKFFIETDFQGGNADGNQSSSNSAEMRIRQIYGTIGGWTAGQTWSLWEDRATIANSLDINAPLGVENGIRAPVIQHMWTIPGGHQFSVGVEEPYNDFSGADKEVFVTGATNQPTNNVTKAPDLTFKYAFNPSWGRLTLTGVGRYLETDTAGSTLTNGLGKAVVSHDGELGWGLSAGGKVKTGLGDPRNSVTFRVSGGEGVGRYMQGISPASAYLNNAGQLELTNTLGIVGSYQHWILDNVQANLIAGKERVYYPGQYISAANMAGLQKDIEEVELNAYWTITPQVQVGAAYYYADTSVAAPLSLAGVPGTSAKLSGTTAHDSRIQFSTIVGF